MTLSSRFVDSFDPSKATHVIWLSKFFDFAENLASQRGNIDSFINTNPMGIVVKHDEMLEWVHIHFVLAMKYSQAVLKGSAFIPPQTLCKDPLESASKSRA